MLPIRLEDLKSSGMDENQLLEVLQYALWRLEAVQNWNRDNIFKALESVADAMNIKLKPFLVPLFIAITGSTASISVMDSMNLLGADMSRARLRHAIELLGGVGKNKSNKGNNKDKKKEETNTNTNTNTKKTSNNNDVIPGERTCGWCGWSERWTNKDRKMRSKCVDCGTINYCDNRCRRNHLKIHGRICRMIIERKGRGKELDKLFNIAITYMKNDEELDLYKMIKKHPDLLNWKMDEYKGAGLLYAACEMNKVSILDTLLLPLHVNENLKAGNEEQTPLMVACGKGHTDCVSVLLGPLIRANVNAVANHGDTALHIASQCNSASCIPLLIDGGADVNAVDNNGYTALDIAKEKGHTAIVDLLTK